MQGFSAFWRAIAEVLDLAVNAFDHVLVVGQVAVAKLAGLAGVGHLLGELLDAGGEFLEFSGRDTVLANGVGACVFPIERKTIHNPSFGGCCL